MKNTRKFTLLLICAVLALIAIFAMSGCGEEENPPASSSTQESHQHSYGEWNVTKQPTCTEKGSQEKVCSCGDKVDEEIPATGHTEEVVAGKDATCTETGLTEGKKCTVCGETTVAQETVPAKGHTEEVVAGKDATCTETGLTEGKKCTVCGETTVAQETVPAKGHTEEVIAGKDATCTETGLTEGKKCTVCGEITVAQETVPAKGHTEEVVAGKDATCTETGLTDGKKCTVCGEITVAQETVPAKGHSPSDTYSYDANSHWYVCKACNEKLEIEAHIPDHDAATEEYGVKCTECGYVIEEPLDHVHRVVTTISKVEPDCETDGNIEYYRCSCGKFYSDSECTNVIEDLNDVVIDATGHTEKAVSGYDATCTEKGLTDGVECSVCGKTLTEQEEIPALDHDIVEHEKVDATCTEKGNKAYQTCTRCDYTTFEEIPALDHDIVEHEKVDATCTEKGNKAYQTCTRCNYTTFEEIAATGHTETTVSGYAPTCTEKGLTDGVKCSVCNEVLTAQEEIPENGHTEVILESKAPTCSEAGLTEGKKCSVCNEILIAQEEIPATGHTVVFKNNGNTVSTVNVACGSKVTAPSVSAVAGYELDGWFTNGSEWSFGNGVTEDMTLEAKWNLIIYTVTFKNGNAVVEVVEFTVATESIVEPSVPEKAGFVGKWESYTLGTESIVVNAIYTSETYTITYENLNGASNPNKTSYTSLDTPFTLASISMDGYVFLGWYIDDVKVTEITSDTNGDLVIYAKWAKYIEDKTSGSIIVEDKLSGNLTGTYDYEIVDGVIVVYKNGVVTSDIAVIANVDGTYSFASVALPSPQAITKVAGEEYTCSVKLSIGGSLIEVYVLTFTDDRIPDEQQLVLGERSEIVVDNLIGGTNISFTATEKGKYELAFFAGETNGIIYLDGTEKTLPCEFELEKGQTIVFNVKTNNGQADTIDLVLQKKIVEPPKVDLPDDEL